MTVSPSLTMNNAALKSSWAKSFSVGADGCLELFRNGDGDYHAESSNHVRRSGYDAHTVMVHPDAIH